MKPMVEQIRRRYERLPQEVLADGGFIKRKDITDLEREGIRTYLPIMELEQKRAKGIDPYAPAKRDTPQVSQWRARMGLEAARMIYRQRASTAEFSNAGCRNRGLYQFVVRGLKKAKAIALWHALAHNFHRIMHLKRQIQPTGTT